MELQLSNRQLIGARIIVEHIPNFPMFLIIYIMKICDCTYSGIMIIKVEKYEVEYDKHGTFCFRIISNHPPPKVRKTNQCKKNHVLYYYITYFLMYYYQCVYAIRVRNEINKIDNSKNI